MDEGVYDIPRRSESDGGSHKISGVCKGSNQGNPERIANSKRLYQSGAFEEKRGYAAGVYGLDESPIRYAKTVQLMDERTR
jgi:hypothetical protein